MPNKLSTIPGDACFASNLTSKYLCFDCYDMYFLYLNLYMVMNMRNVLFISFSKYVSLSIIRLTVNSNQQYCVEKAEKLGMTSFKVNQIYCFCAFWSSNFVTQNNVRLKSKQKCTAKIDWQSIYPSFHGEHYRYRKTDNLRISICKYHSMQ